MSSYNAKLLASEAGRDINSRVRSIYNTVNKLNIKSEVQSLTGNDLLRVMDEIYSANRDIVALQDTPGLDAFFKEAYDDPVYDSLTALEVQRLAMVDIGTTIRDSFPVDGNGYLLQHKFLNVVERTDRLFNTTSMAPLRAKIVIFKDSVQV